MDAMEEKYELAKWLAGEMSEEELIAFQQSPDYAAYVKIAAYSSQLEAPGFDAESLYQNTINSKKKAPKVIPFNQSRLLKIAAIFVLLLSITYFYRSNATSTEIAENGKKTSFALPDNSQIVLNSGSQIEYKKWNWDNNRKLDLQGEAYFKVAHGKKFEVDTKIGTVTVLGTQFNVKSRNERFDVSCYEGRVKVTYKGKEVVITKGTSVSFDNNYFDQKSISATKPEWTQNQIVFSKENLHIVIEELERQYNCKIVLNCKENKQLFTGTLPAGDRKTAVDIIASIFHLRISENSANKIILEDF